jgi:hypothetical protein
MKLIYNANYRFDEVATLLKNQKTISVAANRLHLNALLQLERMDDYFILATELSQASHSEEKKEKRFLSFRNIFLL